MLEDGAFAFSFVAIDQDGESGELSVGFDVGFDVGIVLGVGSGFLPFGG